MSTKKKNIFIGIVLTAFIALFAALFIPLKLNSVYAMTTTSAEMTTNGTVFDSSGNVISIGAPENYYTVTMYALNSQGTGTLNNNSVLDWSYVTIKVNAISNIRSHLSFILKKDGVDINSKSLSGTETQILYQGELDDGNYELLYNTTYNTSKSSFINALYKFNFTIDTSAPLYELKGGEHSINDGGNTSKQLTYSASDPHFQRLYYKSPTASSYSTTTKTSYTVEPTVSNSGWWYFYAIDSLGQKSETVKAYLDCIPPVMQCANGLYFGTTVGDTIKVTATDEIASAKLYVKFENEEWFSAGNSYSIPDTERNGRYYFYAEDGNGNRSETSWIVLSTEEPSGSIIKSETDNSMSFVWNNEYWSATLDGANYTEGRLISNEGQHEIVLSNNAYKSKRYNFSIEHYYKLISQSPSTCLTNGIKKYECSQCGYRYEETEFTSGHRYSIISTPSTCTDREHIVYRCSVCGDKYEAEGNYPTGHNYISTVTVEPTCTTEGKRLIKCESCGDEYTVTIAANEHKYEITDIKQDNGNTTRTYTCETCGDSYKQELGDQYEEVANYVEYLFQQYSPYMWWVLLATAAVWSIGIGVVIVIANKNEDKEKSKKMLINYLIGLVVIAVIVVACPYLIRGIAALIT